MCGEGRGEYRTAAGVAPAEPTGSSAKRTKGAAPGSAEKRPRSNAPTDRRSAWVLRDGEPRQVSVRIGISDGTYTELLPLEGGADSPLKEGDEVITEAYGGPSASAAAGGASRGSPGGGSFRRLF